MRHTLQPPGLVTGLVTGCVFLLIQYLYPSTSWFSIAILSGLIRWNRAVPTLISLEQQNSRSRGRNTAGGDTFLWRGGGVLKITIVLLVLSPEAGTFRSIFEEWFEKMGGMSARETENIMIIQRDQ